MSEPKHSHRDQQTCMILVMGVTGSGKSYFINQLVKGAVKEGQGINSETNECKIVEAVLNDRTKVAVVDTPGFDDSHRSDDEILSEIVQFLVIQHQLGIPLRGIIYLHRITDNKMQGSAKRYLRMFEKLCGEHALSNVIILSTMWDLLPSRAVGLQRARELRREHFGWMEQMGSSIAEFDGSPEYAQAVVIELLCKRDVVLDIQREVCEEGLRLGETSAGQLIAPEVDASLNKHKSQIQDIEEGIEKARRNGDRKEKARLERLKMQAEEQSQRDLKTQERLRADVRGQTRQLIGEKRKKSSKWNDHTTLFAAIMGLGVSLVFNLLPLFGVNV